VADRYSLRRGYVADVEFINVANLPALAGAKSSGRKAIGTVVYVHLFGHYLTLRSPGVRKIGIEFFKPEGQQIRLAEAG
jgi:hypothetical protein